jgi:hypothetical protein
MTADDVKSWRKAERERLITARERCDAETLALWRQRIDTHLPRAFPGLAAATLGFCWPSRSFSASGIPAWPWPPARSGFRIR